MTNILDVKLDPIANDASASSVREYLKALLARVWEEEESFNGKRPFGNSGWQYEVCEPVVAAGLAADVDAARELVLAAIQTL